MHYCLITSFGSLASLYRGWPHRGQFRARSAESNTCSSHPTQPCSFTHSAPLVALRNLSALRRIALGLSWSNISPSISFIAADEQFNFVCRHLSLTAFRTGDDSMRTRENMHTQGVICDLKTHQPMRKLAEKR